MKEATDHLHALETRRSELVEQRQGWESRAAQIAAELANLRARIHDSSGRITRINAEIKEARRAAFAGSEGTTHALLAHARTILKKHMAHLDPSEAELLAVIQRFLDD